MSIFLQMKQAERSEEHMMVERSMITINSVCKYFFTLTSITMDDCVKSRSLLLVVFVDKDLWKKYVPQPVQVRTDNIYDYYDILEELGR